MMGTSRGRSFITFPVFDLRDKEWREEVQTGDRDN